LQVANVTPAGGPIPGPSTPRYKDPRVLRAASFVENPEV
jgi:hypothetical protein